jgi:hypothetical protein
MTYEPLKRIMPEANDELRPEYDLRSLRVRKFGPARKSFGTVRSEPDSAEVFSDADNLVANVSDESCPASIDL